MVVSFNSNSLLLVYMSPKTLNFAKIIYIVQTYIIYREPILLGNSFMNCLDEINIEK